jgi:hypothetical protein
MSKPSKTPSTIPAENASQLNWDRSFGIEMCCVNGGLFRVNMSVEPNVERTSSMYGERLDHFHDQGKVGRTGGSENDRLTLVVPLNALFQPIRRSAETIPVHLGMYEL